MTHREVSPENNPIRSLLGLYAGPAHTNGSFQVWQDMTGFDLSGPRSQFAEFWDSPSPPGACDVIQCNYDRARIPEPEELMPLLELAANQHSYSAWDSESRLLTTWIQFDRGVYHVAQFAQEQVVGTDTLYALPWRTKLLPRDPALIRVEGVARIQGIVNGRVTLAAEDSLFLTGDLVTADVDLSNPAEILSYGTVPFGSPNRIGIIGLGNVILAATKANGLDNGALADNSACQSPYAAVLPDSLHAGRDIVITAAVLAAGCSFETEFWKTTASTIPPAYNLYSPCGGLNNQHNAILPSCTDSGTLDMRGRIWFCGSLVTRYKGHLLRSPIGPWGMATIGYWDNFFRHDPNFLEDPPPLWPELVWEDPDPLEVLISQRAADLCGTLAEPEAFRALWIAGQVGLRIRYPMAPDMGLEETCRIRFVVDDLVVEEIEHTLQPGDTIHVEPDFPLPDHAASVYVSVSWDSRIWNGNGEVCRWELAATGVTSNRPDAAFGIRIVAAPNPFNPTTLLRVTQDRPGPVRLRVYNLQGQRVRALHEGYLEAGNHTFPFHAGDLAAGIYLCRLESRQAQVTEKLLLLP